MPSLVHRGGDEWQVRVSAGRGWQASRVFHASGRREAERQRDELVPVLRRELEDRKEQHRLETDINALTVATLTELWLRSRRLAGRSSATMGQYEASAALWLPTLGKKLAAKLAPGDVDRWVTSLDNGPARVRQVVKDMESMLRHGAKKFPHDMPGTPVTKAVDLPAHRPKQKSLPQVERLFAAVPKLIADGQVGVAGAIALGTGMRQGEICALDWADVHDDRVHIGWSMARNGDRKRPKTGHSRDVPISPIAREAFAAARAFVVGTADEGSPLVLPSPAGGRWRPDSISSAWPAVARRCGLGGITFHGLRHATGSMLLMGGTPVPQVAAALGHANSQVTMDTYAHVLGALPDDLWESVTGLQRP